MNWQKIDSLVHSEIIERIIEKGFCPSLQVLCERLDISMPVLYSAFERLADNHALVLHPDRKDPWIVHPFSLSPTATWVDAGDRGWWAPCLWCAFGIAALVGGELTVHARIGGESEPVQIHFRDGQLIESGLFVHFSIPPRNAWNNVHHFCATVLAFKDPADAKIWSERHSFDFGEVMRAEKLMEFSKLWYGRHSSKDWVKCSASEAQEIFKKAGLEGDFWKLDAGGERY